MGVEFGAPLLSAREQLEAKYRKEARRRYHDEGHIEVDEKAEVSISDENAEGCYVQAWVYVPRGALYFTPGEKALQEER